jgi:hypothetical protein
MPSAKEFSNEEMLENLKGSTHTSQLTSANMAYFWQHVLDDPAFARQARRLVENKIKSLEEGGDSALPPQVRSQVLRGWTTYLDQFGIKGAER